MPPQTNIIKARTLTDQVVAWVRQEVWRAPDRGQQAVLSERKLAETYGVSRTTARRALRRLMAEGYLVSVPRQGYVLSPEARSSEGAVALVRRRSDSGRERGGFNARIRDALEGAAAERQKDLLFVGREGCGASEVAARVREHGVFGVVVDCGDVKFARQLRDTGLPVVVIDAADPGVESVTQDNFGGAMLATQMLIDRGHRRIACLLFDELPHATPVHHRERRAGFLAAMTESELPVPEEWVISAAEVPHLGDDLAALAGSPDGPTAAVVLWSELMPDVGRALQNGGPDVELSAWWGAIPEHADSWRADFPDLGEPLGVSWDTVELATRALDQIEALRRNPERPPARTVIAVRPVSRRQADTERSAG